VASVGTIGTIAIAGCNSSSNTDTESSDSENGVEARTHEIGEPFTIGEGDRVVEYTVNDVYGQRSIGSNSMNEKASGVFTIVELTLENKTDESFKLTPDNIILFDPDNDVEFEAEAGVNAYLPADSRIEPEGPFYEQLNPNLAEEGVIVYDIPGGTYAVLKFEPLGFLDSSDPHYVHLGSAPES